MEECPDAGQSAQEPSGALDFFLWLPFIQSNMIGDQIKKAATLILRGLIENYIEEIVTPFVLHQLQIPQNALTEMVISSVLKAAVNMVPSLCNLRPVVCLRNNLNTWFCWLKNKLADGFYHLKNKLISCFCHLKKLVVSFCMYITSLLPAFTV